MKHYNYIRNAGTHNDGNAIRIPRSEYNALIAAETKLNIIANLAKADKYLDAEDILSVIGNGDK